MNELTPNEKYLVMLLHKFLNTDVIIECDNIEDFHTLMEIFKKYNLKSFTENDFASFKGGSVTKNLPKYPCLVVSPEPEDDNIYAYRDIYAARDAWNGSHIIGDIVTAAELKELNRKALYDRDIDYYLKQFSEGNLIVDCEDSFGFSALNILLEKCFFKPVDISGYFRNGSAYVFFDEYDIPQHESSLDDISREYGIHNHISISDLKEIDKLHAARRIDEFKHNKLIVNVANKYQYKELMAYLEANGMVQLTDTPPEYHANTSYFYANAYEYYTAIDFNTIRNFYHCNGKVVGFSYFLPKLQDLYLEEKKLVNKEDLIAALYDRFHEENQPNNITQVNLGDIISFIKDYEPDFSKENEDLDYDSKEDELEL